MPLATRVLVIVGVHILQKGLFLSVTD